MADAPVRVGFLGAGLIATYHSKSLRRSGAQVERSGVFDPDAARASAFAMASGHSVMGSERDVIESCDAVYVCTWTSEHRRLVELAVEHGKHVFCEKPLATNLHDAAAMSEVVAASGVVNQCGLVLRHSPAYLMARELVCDSEAGDVMAVVFRDDQFIPVQGHYASTWRGDVSKAGAGTLLEHSIHDVDMLRFLVGDIESVNARETHRHGLSGIEDALTSTFAFSNGAIGTLASVWHDNLSRPSQRRVEIFCRNRTVTIAGDDWFGPVMWSDALDKLGVDEHSISGDDLVRATEHLAPLTPNPDGAFIRAISTGAQAFPGFDVALRAHAIVDAMYESARSNGSSINVSTGAQTNDTTTGQS